MNFDLLLTKPSRYFQSDFSLNQGNTVHTEAVLQRSSQKKVFRKVYSKSNAGNLQENTYASV